MWNQHSCTCSANKLQCINFFSPQVQCNLNQTWGQKKFTPCSTLVRTLKSGDVSLTFGTVTICRQQWRLRKQHYTCTKTQDKIFASCINVHMAPWTPADAGAHGSICPPTDNNTKFSQFLTHWFNEFGVTHWTSIIGPMMIIGLAKLWEFY